MNGLSPQDGRDLGSLLAELESAARAAGGMALPYFRQGGTTSAAVRTKEGGSPVTEADMLLDQYLEQRLRAALPGAAWLSEESVDDPLRLDHEAVIVVDPIDGTRAFVNGDPRWAVALAYVVGGRPVAGVVHLPALDETYAAHLNGGARLNGAPVRVSGAGEWRGLTFAGPVELSNTMKAAEPSLTIVPRIPSLAYRLVRVASGHLDAGFAFPNSNDWDIAAADIILTEAGGILSTVDGDVPAYNRASPKHGALVAAPRALHVQAMEAARSARDKVRRKHS